MSLSDPVANALTIIRNGVKRKKKRISFSYSNFKWEICKKLVSEGFIKETFIEKNNINSIKEKKISVRIDYKSTNDISTIKKISTPTKHVYVKHSKTKKKNYGFLLISTSKGLLTEKEAFENKIGGKIILSIL